MNDILKGCKFEDELSELSGPIDNLNGIYGFFAVKVYLYRLPKKSEKNFYIYISYLELFYKISLSNNDIFEIFLPIDNITTKIKITDTIIYFDDLIIKSHTFKISIIEFMKLADCCHRHCKNLSLNFKNHQFLDSYNYAIDECFENLRTRLKYSKLKHI